MTKFKENELTKKIENFKKEKVLELELERGIVGSIKIEKASIEYCDTTGFIQIAGEGVDWKINTTEIYEYREIENGIEIDLETVVVKIYGGSK